MRCFNTPVLRAYTAAEMCEVSDAARCARRRGRAGALPAADPVRRRSRRRLPRPRDPRLRAHGDPRAGLRRDARALVEAMPELTRPERRRTKMEFLVEIAVVGLDALPPERDQSPPRRARRRPANKRCAIGVLLRMWRVPGRTDATRHLARRRRRRCFMSACRQLPLFPYLDIERYSPLATHYLELTDAFRRSVDAGDGVAGVEGERAVVDVGDQTADVARVLARPGRRSSRPAPRPCRDGRRGRGTCGRRACLGSAARIPSPSRFR